MEVTEENMLKELILVLCDLMWKGKLKTCKHSIWYQRWNSFLKCKSTANKVNLSVMKSISQLKKVEFNKNATSLFINGSAGNWHFVTVQMQLEYSPYVIFPFSSSSTALKRCVTSICDTPMAVFRIWAKSSSVIVPLSDWYSYESRQQDKSLQSWMPTPINSTTLK